jgi:hypothetical protein
VVTSYTVRVLDPLTDSRWPGFVERHSAASVFHSRGWLRALQKTYGYEPLAITTSTPIEPLTNALLFCVVQSWMTGDRVVSLPFTDHCEPLVENIKQFRASIDGIGSTFGLASMRYTRDSIRVALDGEFVTQNGKD